MGMKKKITNGSAQSDSSPNANILNKNNSSVRRPEQVKKYTKLSSINQSKL